MTKLFKLASASILLFTSSVMAQNVVQTGVPYLLISPDARAAGLGDQGVATSPDNNSLFWNMSKLAFIKEKNGISVSYSPWLEAIVNDVSISNINWYSKLNNRSAYSVNVKYFSLGEITFRQSADEAGQQYSPNEFTIDAGYAMQLSRRLSAGVVLRYINSNLTAGYASSTDNVQYQPGQSIASDVSMYYKSKKFDLSGKNANYTMGLNVSNLGGKIRYQDGGPSEFLPANMKLGAGLHVDIDNYNKISVIGELNKLLVPTTHKGDAAYNQEIKDLSVVDGIFRSFNDSPTGETELQELAYSIGLEYLYNNQFVFRTGYFYEDEDKGNRQYASFGFGVKLKKASLDVAYLATTTNANNNHPLKNTLRFTLNISLDAITSDFEEDEVDRNSKKEEKKSNSKKKSKKNKSKKKSDDK